MTESFPHPLPPTAQEVAAQEQKICLMSLVVPPLILGALLTLVFLIAFAISANFNIFYWLE